jgi:[acyl-carrier-protein] S-malonyltransferase
VVISGEKSGVERAMEIAKEVHGRARLLAVSIAAHSALMASIADEFAVHVAATPFDSPSVPVIGNLSAGPLTSRDEIQEELVRQLTGPVRWTKSVITMVEGGVDRFVEIGPGSVLTGLVKRIVPEMLTANAAEPSYLGDLYDAAG